MLASELDLPAEGSNVRFYQAGESFTLAPAARALNVNKRKLNTMKIPTMHGVIDRRILVNYRSIPTCCRPVLPPPFHPKLVRGVGIAGICLIRLKGVRPAFVPSWLGIASENAAHRVAVEWRDDTGR